MQKVLVIGCPGSGKSTFSRVGELSEIDVLVTNKKDNCTEIDVLNELGVEVYQVE